MGEGLARSGRTNKMSVCCLAETYWQENVQIQTQGKSMAQVVGILPNSLRLAGESSIGLPWRLRLSKEASPVRSTAIHPSSESAAN